MNDSVIVAIVAGLASAIPAILTTISTSKSNQVLNEYRFSELRNDFENLRIKVEKHNGVVERTTVLEHEVKMLKDQMK